MGTHVESTINQLMTGALAMGFAVAALFFLKFWKATEDRLFALFAVSFVVLAFNRVALGMTRGWEMRGDYLYWVRLLAFAIILAAVIDKNRSRPREGGG
jgi:hypothetical protein